MAIKALLDQELFVYPTDTIYGFGGAAISEKVIETLYTLKERPVNMPVSMLVRDADMLNEYANISLKAKKLIDRFLPGALTLVLPAKEISLPDKLFSVKGYLGFRIPDHEFCRKLTQVFNEPVITTSVNISGRPALNRISDIEKQFGGKVDLLISDRDLENKRNAKGSTVVMISEDDDLKLLREGWIPEEEIHRTLRD